MNVYLDTSQIVKLFVRETGTAEIHELIRGNVELASSIVSYAETRAAIAHARRANRLTYGEYHVKLTEFEDRWRDIQVIDVDDSLVRLAGDLAEKHALRGFDAIHLASAITLHRALDEPVHFSAADDRLVTSAEAEGLTV